MRKLIPDDAAKTVACAMVAGRLDYCNAVLYGYSSANIDNIYSVCRTHLLESSSTLADVIASLRYSPIHTGFGDFRCGIVWNTRKPS